jgi:arylsulfatase A-like enzyme
MTDRAIEVGRDHDPERMVVHYLQPHHPFIPDPELDPGQSIENFNEEAWDDIWDRLRHGEVSKERVWNAYRENLRYVLADVELLLENVDAETVVITSDHGNAFGEWGIYGHPNGSLHPAVKHVPWAVTNAADTGEYDPDVERESSEASVEERLDGLGYL